jgi:hypothetical protein
MKRSFFRVADIRFNEQHGCNFVTLKSTDTGKRFAIGEFAFATTPKKDDEMVRLETRKGEFRGYRTPTIADRVLARLGL